MSQVFRVIKNGNYTVMSNVHLKDRRLSYKAKGLLSEMLSLPPDWDYSLPGLAAIAADGIDAVRTAINELEKYGYVRRPRQLRDENGRMAASEYLVYENPRDNPFYKGDLPENAAENGAAGIRKRVKGAAKGLSPSSENPMTVEKKEKSDFLRPPSLDLPLSEKPSSENPMTVSFNKLNTQVLNTHRSITRAGAKETAGGSDEAKSAVKVLSKKEREKKLAEIKESMEYDWFYGNRDCKAVKVDMKKVDEIVSIMLDVVCSSSPTIRVNGEDVPQEIVKERFMSLNSSHIEYAIEVWNENKKPIRTIRGYLITILYNAPVLIDSYYEEKVRQDMGYKEEDEFGYCKRKSRY